MSIVLVPVSIGELFDKVSILKIKIERITDQMKISNCQTELELLSKIFLPYYEKNSDLFEELKQVNEQLWEIEDDIRIKEKNKEFDEEFIRLARLVYVVNDQRSNVKGKINIFFGSKINEVKSYEDYQ